MYSLIMLACFIYLFYNAYRYVICINALRLIILVHYSFFFLIHSKLLIYLYVYILWIKSMWKTIFRLLPYKLEAWNSTSYMHKRDKTKQKIIQDKFHIDEFITFFFLY